MENQHSALLNWAYFFQGKNVEELRHSLFCATLELEQTRVAVEEELRKRDEQLIQLKEICNRAIRERDEANEKYQKLLIETRLLHEQNKQRDPNSGVSSINEDEQRKGSDNINNNNNNNGLSSSDCEESIVSSPTEKALLLPEKGKLLEAVMKAGPLLQTLLVAGPLPQWRHPPPPLESFQIPPPPQILQDSPVSFSGSTRKRGFMEGSDDSPTQTKQPKSNI